MHFDLGRFKSSCPQHTHMNNQKWNWNGQSGWAQHLLSPMSPSRLGGDWTRLSAGWDEGWRIHRLSSFLVSSRPSSLLCLKSSIFPHRKGQGEDKGKVDSISYSLTMRCLCTSHSFLSPFSSCSLLRQETLLISTSRYRKEGFPLFFS